MTEKISRVMHGSTMPNLPEHMTKPAKKQNFDKSIFNTQKNFTVRLGNKAITRDQNGNITNINEVKFNKNGFTSVDTDAYGNIKRSAEVNNSEAILKNGYGFPVSIDEYNKL